MTGGGSTAHSGGLRASANTGVIRDFGMGPHSQWRALTRFRLGIATT